MTDVAARDKSNTMVRRTEIKKFHKALDDFKFFLL